MVEFIKKVGIIFMALATMITMSACSNVNKDTANEISDALYEKYGKSFVVTKIGDRFNTDHAKVYVHPAENKELLFVAKMDRDTGKVEDNYIIEKLNYQIEKTLEKVFKDRTMSAVSICDVVTNKKLDVGVEDYTVTGFLEKHGLDHYTVYLLVEDKGVTPSGIIDALEECGVALGVKLLVRGYGFNSEGFKDCVEQSKEYPDMGVTMIESQSPLWMFKTAVESGKCSIPENELSNAIEGD